MCPKVVNFFARFLVFFFSNASLSYIVVDSEVGVGCCSSECEVVEYRFEPDGETEFCQDGYNHIVRRSKVKSSRLQNSH